MRQVDDAERLRWRGTSERASPARGLPLKEFAYDDPTGIMFPQCGGGLCNGKLTAAARYNYTTVNGTTNRYTTMTYDAAGNITNDGKGAYAYDALGMMTAATVGGRNYRYLYMANEERIAAVERVVVGSIPRTKTTWTLRGLGPQLQRVNFDDNTGGTRVFTWKEDVFWRGSQLLGSDTPTGLRHYGLDHLGSPRIITDASGATLGTQDFTPFGTGGTSNGGTNQFTGQERDAASLGGGSVDLADYFHARYYRADGGRFLSVDPVITKAAGRAPQLWSRYAYVGNNPLKMVDPDGRLLQLSACKQDAKSDACTSQFNLYLSTFGKQAGAAAKYLSVGKNGVVGFKGISGSDFASKFGMMGRATNYLVSNRAATFSLVTGSSGRSAKAGGAFFDAGSVGGTIGIDTAAFPISRGRASISATEALAHEIGHAVGSLIPGVRDALDARLGGAATRTLWTVNEGYSMAWENRWRVEVLGVPANDLRMFYNQSGDVFHDGDAQLFP